MGRCRTEAAMEAAGTALTAYGAGAHPMAAVPILPKYRRPLVSITLVTGP